MISRYIYLTFLLLSWNLNAQNILTNEVMSSNETIISDEDGDFSDWIELYNNADSALNLEGYGLSDDSLNLAKWQFPNIELPAGQHMFLFASGKDRIATISYWETVIREGDIWKYAIGNATIPSDWVDSSYNDSTWSEGPPSGFGYGDSDDATMLSEGVSVYIRKKFAIEDTSVVTQTVLHVDYDNAFVAYLNGLRDCPV